MLKVLLQKILDKAMGRGPRWGDGAANDAKISSSASNFRVVYLSMRRNGQKWRSLFYSISAMRSGRIILLVI
jgi:hypothetical protein